MSARQESIFKQVEFLRLSERRILLVVVAPNDEVHNRLLLTDVDYSPAQLVQTANYLNQHFAGQSFEQARMSIHHEMRTLQSDMNRLMCAAVDAVVKRWRKNNEDMVISVKNLLNVRKLSSNMTSFTTNV